MIKVSFSSLADPKSPLETFAALLKKHQYDGIELRTRENDHVFWTDPPERRQYVKKLFADAGLEIAAISTYLHLGSREKETANREDIKKAIDLAADLGTKNVRVFGGKLSPGDTFEMALPRVVELLKLGGTHNPAVTLGFELHEVWSTGQVAAKVLDAVGLPNVQALWDVHGPTPKGESPPQTLKHLGPQRISYLHIKDSFFVPGEERKYQCFMGAGDIPCREIVRVLRKAGWAGYLNVEWEGTYFPYMPPMEIAMVQGIMKLREYLAEK